MAQQFETSYDTTPEPAPRRWPLSRVFWIDLAIIIVLVLVLSVVVGVVVGFLAIRSGQITPGQLSSGLTQDAINRIIGPTGLFAVLLFQNAILLFVPIIRVRLLRKEPLAEIGFRAQRPLRLVLFGIGLGVAVLLANSLLSLLFVNVFGIKQNQAAQYPLFAGDYTGQALFLIGAAVLAPIGEETLFRGYAFNAFRQGWARSGYGLAAAYLVSALLFSLAHSVAATEGVIGLLVPTFAMGLILAWGMHRTGSLLPCIIAHGINNSVALVALLVCVNNPGIPNCPAL